MTGFNFFNSSPFEFDTNIKSVSKSSQKILDRAYTHIKSVGYTVSLRWVFYRLLQDGIYKSKEDYKKLVHIASVARKNGIWEPDLLADETRKTIDRNGDGRNVAEWLEYVSQNLQCRLDAWYDQKNYVECWFEAKAMTDQFRSIVPAPITLVPFGGDASIPYKYQCAVRLQRAADKYGLPITILYFGDLDRKGQQIPYSAQKDIQNWFGEFEFRVVGLNRQQVEIFNLPQNPDKRGEYQWESLSDSQAKSLILGAIEPLFDHGLYLDRIGEGDEAEEWLREKIQEKIGEETCE